MFRIYLTINEQAYISPPRSDETKEYDPVLNDIGTLLSDICEVLQEAGSISFIVEGFGQVPWPVDVAIDLVVCLEELPDLIEWLTSGSVEIFEWLFYEQGTDRKLLLENCGQQIRATCQSWGNWQPHQEVEIIPRSELEAMLRDLVRVFVSQALQCCPNAVAHPWFQEWHRSVQIRR